MQPIIGDTFELCLRLVTAIVEQVADAAAASSGQDRFEIEAQLLRQLMQDLPRQIKAADEAVRRTVEDRLDSCRGLAVTVEIKTGQRRMTSSHRWSMSPRPP
jgi:hypothetical protein